MLTSFICRSGQHASFGTASREMELKVWLSEEHAKAIAGSSPHQTRNPGPGTYKIHGSVGPQPISKSQTLPAWKLGTEERFSASKAKGDINSTPAPGEYNSAYSSVGPQAFSTKKSAPTMSFGTSTRDKRFATIVCFFHQFSLVAVLLSVRAPDKPRTQVSDSPLMSCQQCK